MTYIDYLNSFHQWCESNTLPGNSRLLYMELLHVFNRAGWPENVRVDNLRLTMMAGVATEKSAIRARDLLIGAGLITYQKGKKGMPGKYSLNEIPCNYYSVYDRENDSVSDSVFDRENDNLSDRENDSHIKTKTKKKTKTKTSIPPLIPPREETGFGEALQAAFEAWLAYKREKRQAYQPTGLQSLVTEIRRNADEYGEQAVADLIRKCMASNWQGIIFDRLETGGRGKAAQPDAVSSAPSRAELERMQKLRERMKGDAR